MLEFSSHTSLGEHIRDYDINEAVVAEILEALKMAQYDNLPQVEVCWEHERPTVGGLYSPIDNKISIYLSSLTLRDKGSSVVLGHELTHVKNRVSNCVESLAIPSLAGLTVGLNTGFSVGRTLDQHWSIEVAAGFTSGSVSGIIASSGALLFMSYAAKTLGGSAFSPINEWRSLMAEGRFKHLDDFITYELH